MVNPTPFLQTQTTASEDEIAVYAKMVRAAVEAVPHHKRAAVIAQIGDLLEKPRTPQRGGEVLNNVVSLLKQEKRSEWRAADMVSALERSGVSAEPKQVYSALQYLQSRRVLQKKGYGLYVLEDGSIIEGLP